MVGPWLSMLGSVTEKGKRGTDDRAEPWTGAAWLLGWACLISVQRCDDKVHNASLCKPQKIADSVGGYGRTLD